MPQQRSADVPYPVETNDDPAAVHEAPDAAVRGLAWSEGKQTRTAVQESGGGGTGGSTGGGADGRGGGF